MGDGVALELDDQAHAGAVGFVAQVGDLGDLLGLHQLDDVLDEGGAVDLVGQLGDHDGGAVALDLLGVGLGAHADAAAPGAVGLFDAGRAEDDAAGGKVGTGDVGHEVVGRSFGVVDERGDGVDHLAQVVGRDVGGHADGDAAGAVDQRLGRRLGSTVGSRRVSS